MRVQPVFAASSTHCHKRLRRAERGPNGWPLRLRVCRRFITRASYVEARRELQTFPERHNQTETMEPQPVDWLFRFVSPARLGSSRCRAYHCANSVARLRQNLLLVERSWHMCAALQVRKIILHD